MERPKLRQPRCSMTEGHIDTDGTIRSALGTRPKWGGFAAVLGIGLSVWAFVLVFPSWGISQDRVPNPTKRRAEKSSTADRPLAVQLRELRSKVLKLEAALEKRHRGDAVGLSGKAGMSKKRGMSSRKMQGKKMMSRSGAMGRKGMGPMSKMGKLALGKAGMAPGMKVKPGHRLMGGRGMRMMGRMGSGGPMEMPSALPGFPGASHIYHIGSTSFFLDHDAHITLSQDQRTKLNRLKEQTLLQQATFDRKIEEAEQKLWKLTASDEPDIVKIDAQVRKIGKLQGDQRIAFIRAVGEAAKLLTDNQRKTLIGTVAAGSASEKSNPAQNEKKVAPAKR